MTNRTQRGARPLRKFLVLAVCGGVSMGVAQMAVSLYGLALGASASQIGLIGGLPSVAVLTTVVPIGLCVDQFGARRMFLMGALFGAVCYAMIPHANTPEGLLACVSITALSLSSRFVSMNAVFLEYLRDAGGVNAGVYRGSHSVGMVVLGPLLGSYVVQHYGHASAFYLVSALLLVAAVLATAVLTGRRNHDGSSPASARGLWAGVLVAVRHREVLGASVGEGLAIMAYSTFNIFIPMVAVGSFGLSTSAVASLIATEGSVFIASLFLMEPVLRKRGYRGFYLLSSTMCIAGLVLLGAASAAAVLWGGTILLGVGLGMLNIANMSRLSCVEIKKGQVAGVFSLFTTMGGILGPLAGGLVGRWLRPQAAFLMLLPGFVGLALNVFRSESSPGHA